jgi:2-keto-4-pentenoate hydratase
MMEFSPKDVARRLLGEHDARRNFHSLDSNSGVVDLKTAYAVQGSFVSLLSREAGLPVGYKIGLTSERMQKICGIDMPIAGTVLSNRVHRTGASLRADSYGHLGLEFEIAVRLGRDLPPCGRPYELDQVAQSVDGVCAAIEMVDDRHADYSRLEVRSLIADNSWNAGIVLGEFRSEWPNLAATRGSVLRNGVRVDSGAGSDVLGHPFVPLTWLANHLNSTGSHLSLGDVVLTGSLVATRFPAESESYHFELSGIGAVQCTVIVS